MHRILFVCIHNSARSQMAEELLRKQCHGDVFVESAGIEPGGLNPLAVEVLAERGIDISAKSTQSVQSVIDSGRVFDEVITVCDESSAERCPIFPGAVKRTHWSFPDPSAFVGDLEERLVQTRRVCDEIERRIQLWCESNCEVGV